MHYISGIGDIFMKKSNLIVYKYVYKAIERIHLDTFIIQIIEIYILGETY